MTETCLTNEKGDPLANYTNVSVYGCNSPSDVNFDHYYDIFYKRIEGLDKGTTPTTRGVQESVIHELKSLAGSFYKNYKNCFVGGRLDKTYLKNSVLKPNYNEESLVKASKLGLITGPESGLFCIDVDYPDKVPSGLMDQLYKAFKSTLVAYKSPQLISESDLKNHRFKVFFLINSLLNNYISENEHLHVQQNNAELGFELLYKGKAGFF